MNRFYKVFTIVLLIVHSLAVKAQLKIGGLIRIPPSQSSILELQSTDRGFMLPAMTYNNMLAIVEPLHGLLVFVNDNDVKGVYCNTGNEQAAKWQRLLLDASPLKADSVIDRIQSSVRTLTDTLQTIDGLSNLYDTLLVLNKMKIKDELYVTSNIFAGGNINSNAYVRGVAFQTISDMRFKTQIENITHADSILNQLRPVQYKWKDPQQFHSTKMQYGFIAQEIEKILPDIVETDAKGYKSLNYLALIPYLVRNVQQSMKREEELKLQFQEQLRQLKADFDTQIKGIIEEQKRLNLQQEQLIKTIKKS